MKKIILMAFLFIVSFSIQANLFEYIDKSDLKGFEKNLESSSKINQFQKDLLFKAAKETVELRKRASKSLIQSSSDLIKCFKGLFYGGLGAALTGYSGLKFKKTYSNQRFSKSSAFFNKIKKEEKINDQDFYGIFFDHKLGGKIKMGLGELFNDRKLFSEGFKDIKITEEGKSIFTCFWSSIGTLIGLKMVHSGFNQIKQGWNLSLALEKLSNARKIEEIITQISVQN